MRKAFSELSAGYTSITSPRTRKLPRFEVQIAAFVLHGNERGDDVALLDGVAFFDGQHHLLILGRVADTVNGGHGGDDNHASRVIRFLVAERRICSMCSLIALSFR